MKESGAMRWSQRREAFRAVLAGRTCIHPASVYDPISARIAEDLGFEAGMFAGSVAATTILGGPDLITITLSEFAEQAHRICRAGNLPLLVDADHGYGNALNVMRTVEELETAGIAGLSIEDTLLPEPFGPSKAAQLLPLEEGLGKMRAALAARCDPKLVIAGRTSAAMLTTTEDAIARATAYQDAGVDAIFLVGVKTRAQMDAIAEAVTLPMIVGGVGTEVMDLEYLAARGVRVCLQGHQPFAAAVQAVHDTLKALRDGVAPRDLKGVASNELMNTVTRNADYQAWMKTFLGKP
jgi:carboxyvinyl-carboxyphosphonate phosphorylmutase